MATSSALTIALVLLVAMPARAQDAPLGDARWAPWLGCWRLVVDERGSLAAATTEPDDVLVCVVPDATDRGVGMTTYVSVQSVVQRTIVADGVSAPVREPACSGSQRSEWSLTWQRLLTRAEITCSGQPTRIVSGIAFMTAGPTWVDIQAVGADQDAQVRVRRYQRAVSPPEDVVLPAALQGRAAAAMARRAGPTSMTLDEVIDASRKIGTPAVEAALRGTVSRSSPDDPYGAYRSYFPRSFRHSPFGYSNWWDNRHHTSTSSSPRPAVVVPEGRARPNNSGPNWWGNLSTSSSPRPAAVVPGERTRPNDNGSKRWGNRVHPSSFSSPRPIVMLPRGPARPSSSGPSWWGDRYSSQP